MTAVLKPREVRLLRTSTSLLLASVVLLGCKGNDPVPDVVLEGVSVVEEPDGPHVLDWVVFEEASAELLDAERHLIEAESRAVARSLNDSADRFEMIARLSVGDDACRLRASGTELRALSRNFPEDIGRHREVLGDVEGRAFLALARHHLLAVDRLVGHHDSAEAGRHLLTATRDVTEGFRASGVEAPEPTRDALEEARLEAERWLDGMPPSPDAARNSSVAVRGEAERLANALGARRK